MSKNATYEDQLHAIQSIMSDDLINFIKNNADDADKVRQRLQDDHILVDGEISDKHQKILDLRLAGADNIAEADRMESVLESAVKVSSGTDAERNSVMNLEHGNHFRVFLENAFKQWGFSIADEEEDKFSQNQISQQLEEYDATLEDSSGVLNKHHNVYTAKHGGLSIDDVIKNDDFAENTGHEIHSVEQSETADNSTLDQQRLEEVMDLNAAKLALMSIAAKFDQGDAYTTLDFEELSNNYMVELHNAGIEGAELDRLLQLPENISDMSIDKLQMIRDLVEPLNNAINDKTAEIQSDSVAEQAQDFTDNYNELFNHDDIVQRMDEAIQQHNDAQNTASLSEIKLSIPSLSS